jgi:hypothetical protein
MPITRQGRDDDGWSLEFDANEDTIYKFFGMHIDLIDLDEEYYPKYESAEIAPKLASMLKILDPQIKVDDYDVSYLYIPNENIRGGVKKYPEYEGNGIFTYKGKSIRYERAEELDNGTMYRYKYKIYDSENNLLDIIEGRNKDFESFMEFLYNSKPWRNDGTFPIHVIEKLL